VCKTGCVIGGTYYASAAVNPGNDCQDCEPAKSTSAWSSRASGTACNDGNACTGPDTCNGSGACAGTKKANGTNIGQGKWTRCCNGVATSLTTRTNCGGCGTACTGSYTCVSPGGTGSAAAYYCNCGGVTANCPRNQRCTNQFWDSHFLSKCAASDGSGNCVSGECASGETVTYDCPTGGNYCTGTQPNATQPCWCSYP
jgi:hypothetical protein